MHELDFFVQFIKNAKKIGALAPSSPFLANKMVRQADFRNAKVIVEFGAGTGSITKHILRKKSPEKTFLIFEPNPKFFSLLDSLYSSNNVHIIQDYAQNLPAY